MNRYLVIIISVLYVPLTTHADLVATVDAGGSDRHAAPVYVNFNQTELSAQSRVRVTGGGHTLPGQVEALANDKVRVWWIVKDLPAGESRRYAIRPGNTGPEDGFVWREAAEYMDLFYEGRPVLEYVCKPYDTNDIENTKKPFHHVFDPDGSRTITKGVGGLYSHHRGIFFGYNKISIGDESYDVWHGREGEHQQHKRVLKKFEGPVFGGHVVRIDWNDREGKPFAIERRSLRAFAQPDGQMLIEFHSTLRTRRRGSIRLDGDRQHAGAQFRASQYVAEHQDDTRYLRPSQWSHLPADQQINTDEHKDLPWNAVQYSIYDRDYTVAYLTDPANPDGAGFSERLYGRFGEFFPHTLTRDTPLRVRYRWWIVDSRDVTREAIAGHYLDLAKPPKVTLQR